MVLLPDVSRQEDEPRAVHALPREFETDPRALRREKFVRHLHEDAGPVSGQGIAAAGTPVRQVLEDLEPLLDDVVGAHALHLGDESDAAGVVLRAASVESIALGRRARLAARRHGLDLAGRLFVRLHVLPRLSRPWIGRRVPSHG